MLGIPSQPGGMGSASAGEKDKAEPYLGVLSSQEVLGAKRQDRPEVSGVALPSSPLHSFSPLQLVHTCKFWHRLVGHLPVHAGKTRLMGYAPERTASHHAPDVIFTSALGAQIQDMAMSSKHLFKHLHSASQRQ